MFLSNLSLSIDNNYFLVCTVCNYSSPARAACPPSIYLVSGHASCSPAQLPDTVAAKQLAEIHSQGYGETLVPLSWDQVTATRTCVLIVRNTDCGAGAAKTAEQQQSCRGLVAASLTRTFSVLSLASVVVLLSGSSGDQCRYLLTTLVLAAAPRPDLVLTCLCSHSGGGGRGGRGGVASSLGAGLQRADHHLLQQVGHAALPPAARCRVPRVAGRL